MLNRQEAEEGVMAERRTLAEGIKPLERSVEEAFVYNAKPKPADEPPLPARRTTIDRIPLTSRIRADLATALKRASLERQLNGIEPSAVQEILEEALEPWLKKNGYLS